MNTAQNVTVFEDADLIRDCVTMLCRDRLPKIPLEDSRERNNRDEAVSKFCWDLFSLQGKTFSFALLKNKCGAIIARAPYTPIRLLDAEELAHEICRPAAGW